MSSSGRGDAMKSAKKIAVVLAEGAFFAAVMVLGMALSLF